MVDVAYLLSFLHKLSRSQIDQRGRIDRISCGGRSHCDQARHEPQIRLLFADRELIDVAAVSYLV
jgi:hypothetical protein